MSESTISKRLLSLDLLSGSNDSLRSAVGGQWNWVSGTAGESYAYKLFKPQKPATSYFSKIESNSSNGFLETVDSDKLMLNKRFPIRIYGNADYVINDTLWSTIFKGGTFEGQTYLPIYSEAVFRYSNIARNVPYSDAASVWLNTGGLATEAASVTYAYNRHLPEFEQYGYNTNERLMPNYYLLCDLANASDIYERAIGRPGVVGTSTSSSYDTEIVNFVTREGTYLDLESLFTINKKAMRADLHCRDAEKLEMLTTSKAGYDYSYLCTNYLTSSLLETSLSGSTAEYMNSRTQNILLDKDAIDKLYIDMDLASKGDYFPYYIKVSFPTEGVSDFGESIALSGFSSKFIKTLYMAFSGQIPELVPRAQTLKELDERYFLSESGVLSLVKTVDDPSRIPTIDYPSFLTHCQNNYSSSAGSCMFMGENNPYRLSATKGGAGNYRFLNTVTAEGVISDVIAHLSSSANFDISSLSDVYGNTQSPSEVLAYRIRKYSVSPDSNTGVADNLADSLIQTYWVVNSNMQEFELFDSQVKYGVEYRYDIAEYRLVQGFRYNFSDLTLTKQLSCDLENNYGVEFYNASTGERADQLFDTSVGRLQKLSAFATMAQTVSQYPFLADMYLNFEPYLEIVELPIHSKTVKVTDNWPAAPKIRPYQLLDASQTLGFEMSFQDHVDKVYNYTLSPSEQSDMNMYFDSRNILPSTPVPYSSISPPQIIQVYRLAKKPTSVEDFSEALIATVQAQIVNSRYSYKTTYFENIIETNKKYYYIFRAVNAAGVIGHLSDIYEVELINDGGYVYNNFKTLTVEELQPQLPPTITKPFKKLLQLIPQMEQVRLDMSEVDLSQPAHSQVDKVIVGKSEDLIWDKTFKIRLSSKKTNKKIDLNITYKLESEY